MRVEIVTLFLFEKKDYIYITKQIKQKGVKVTDFIKQCGVSRSYFHDMLSGARPCHVKTIEMLRKLGIDLPFKGLDYKI